MVEFLRRRRVAPAQFRQQREADQHQLLPRCPRRLSLRSDPLPLILKGLGFVQGVKR